MAANETTTARRYQNLINGDWVNSVSGEMIPRRSPATGQVVAEYAAGNEEDAKKAIAAARTAFDRGPWPRITGAERGRFLYRLAEKMRENKERLALIETEEVGKPIRMARGDIDTAIALVEYAAGLAQHMHGESYNNMGETFTAMVVREPVGVAGLIVPWNFPLVVLCQKLPYALAAGCTVVIKPSEFTSGTALEVARLAEEVGLPSGVINVVTGLGGNVGQAIVDSSDVDFISFTGSTATGRKIINGSADNLKRVSLELGGKGANIVFADADLDDAIDGTLFGIYFNQGEVCCAGSRLLIDDKIADQFLERLVERSLQLKVGDPLDEDTDIGALIHEGHMQKVLGYIESAKEEGAKLLTGGKPIIDSECEKGCFVAPTIFDQVKSNMRIYQEEIFGPVLSVTRFQTVEEAVEIANDTSYGLASALWTKDLDKSMMVSRALRSGTVWVNTIINTAPNLPFGGYKASGTGREMGTAGLDEFTEVKTIQFQIGKRDPYYRK
jgi:betaine-aldehyde dehydrogenase